MLGVGEAYSVSCRHENGHWGRGFCQTKWTSTHYTLLDLKNLNMRRENLLFFVYGLMFSFFLKKTNQYTRPTNPAPPIIFPIVTGNRLDRMKLFQVIDE